MSSQSTKNPKPTAATRRFDFFVAESLTRKTMPGPPGLQTTAHAALSTA